MKIAVPREVHAGERRVATTPDVVKQLMKLGFDVSVESGAGVHASYSDDAYAAERDAMIPDDYDGHRPSAGVGGTRIGVKCLHAHYAYHLAGGDDPVGRWVADRLAADEEAAHDDE